jgi:hypothetical protein
VLDPPEEPAEERPDGAVADTIASADHETTVEPQTETDLDVATELAGADADYASGNTISGEQLRRRYGLS